MIYPQIRAVYPQKTYPQYPQWNSQITLRRKRKTQPEHMFFVGFTVFIPQKRGFISVYPKQKEVPA
jgi:hypothetical protein